MVTNTQIPNTYLSSVRPTKVTWLCMSLMPMPSALSRLIYKRLFKQLLERLHAQIVQQMHDAPLKSEDQNNHLPILLLTTDTILVACIILPTWASATACCCSSSKEAKQSMRKEDGRCFRKKKRGREREEGMD